MYETISYKIKLKDGYLDPIKSNLGLKQGCPLNPMIFNLYIDDEEYGPLRWNNFYRYGSYGDRTEGLQRTEGLLRTEGLNCLGFDRKVPDGRAILALF